MSKMCEMTSLGMCITLHITITRSDTEICHTASLLFRGLIKVRGCE